MKTTHPNAIPPFPKPDFRATTEEVAQAKKEKQDFQQSHQNMVSLSEAMNEPNMHSFSEAAHANKMESDYKKESFESREKEAKIAELEHLQKYRRISFVFIWSFVATWVIFIMAVTIADGLGLLTIAPVPLGTLFGSSTATIVGVLFIAMKYVFPEGGQ